MAAPTALSPARSGIYYILIYKREEDWNKISFQYVEGESKGAKALYGHRRKAIRRPGRQAAKEFDNQQKRGYGGDMKYWETWFLTFGAGCMVGAVISPKSWFAIPVGMALTWIGWKINQKRGNQ